MQRRFRLLSITVVAFAFVVSSCSGSVESAAHHNFTLVGSTACDAAIKSGLGIAADTKCDFIRWSVTLDPSNGDAYDLTVNFGENQPNTLGFVGGGQSISASGKFEMTSRPSSAAIYRLRSTKPALDVALVKINANLFHLLMPDGSMMIGNGGWSYSLYRGQPLAGTGLGRVSFAAAEPSRPTQSTFDGRTPCIGLGRILDVRESTECLKIKWRVVLNRDPGTKAPTTFTINGIIPDRQKNISGRWSESKLPSGAITYKLEPDGGSPGIWFLAADDNLLFFLDANGNPLSGNKDFSFTLNRKI